MKKKNSIFERISKEGLTKKELLNSYEFDSLISKSLQAMLASHGLYGPRLVKTSNRHAIAYTDGNQIFVNPEHPFFQNDVKGNETELFDFYNALLGAIMHESGHLFYTEIPVVGKIFEQMVNGTNFSPFEKNKWGNPEAKAEIVSILKENKKVFTQDEESCNAKSFILRYFWDLQNCIEDGRIEQRLLKKDRRFRGFYYGLICTRERMLFEETKEKAPTKLMEFQALCLFYAKFGKRSFAYNGYTGDFPEFNKACEIINEILKTENPMDRACGIADLISVIYDDYIKPFIGDEPPEEESGSDESSDKSPEKDSKPKDADSGSDSSSGSGSGGSSGSGSDMDDSGSGGSSDEKKDSEPEIDEALRDILKEIYEDESTRASSERTIREEMPEEPSEEEPSDLSKESSSDLSLDEKKSRDDLRKTISEIKDRKANEELLSVKKEGDKKIAEIMNEGDRPKIYIEDVSSPWSLAHINQVIMCAKEKYRKSIKSAARSITRYFEREMKTGISKRNYTGKKFRPQNLVNQDYRYFENKSIKRDVPKLALLILVDESGSMNSRPSSTSLQRYSYARDAVICLYDLFSLCPNMDICVVGHDADNHDCGKSVEIRTYVDFGEKPKNALERLCAIRGRNQNRDADALRFCGKKLEKNPAEKKLLIIISDGAPLAREYSGKPAEKELAQAANEISKKKIDLIAAAIGSDRKEIERIYQNQKYLDIGNLNDLPNEMLKVIKKKIF